MKAPLLPLSPEFQNVVDFCLYFRTPEGFIAEYEKNYRRIQVDFKIKRGLRTKAYELTEQYYCQLFNSGRKYADRESFFNALSSHNRKQQQQ